MTKKNPERLLALFSKKYYGAYAAMIDELRPLLVNPEVNGWLVERLEFRPDLPHGSRKLVYMAVARLLKPGRCVLARGRTKNDVFRWLADERHTNLGVKFQTLKEAVNEQIRLAF